MSVGPGRGTSAGKTKGDIDWAALVETIRGAGFGAEDFEAMLAELVAHPAAEAWQTPEWKRKHLLRAFREAGVEL
jgi:hypothetical protein